MKSRKLLRICVYTIFVMACFSGLAIGDQDDLEGLQFQSVAKESIPDILDQISAQIRGNCDQINTWQGEVEFDDNKMNKGDTAEKIFRNRTAWQGEAPQSIMQRASGTRIFIIDIKNESNYEYLFRKEPIMYIDVNTGIPLDTLPGFSFPLHETMIVTSQEYLECTPNRYRGTTIVSRRAIKKTLEKPIKKGISGQRTTVLKEDVFDPRKFFCMSQLWDYFAECKKRLEQDNEDSNLPPTRFEESRDGNAIVYHMLIPFRATKTQHIFISIYFASETGFNMVKAETLGPEYQKYTSTKIKYTTLGGIYIPYSIDRYTYDINDSSMVSEIKYVIKDQQLNKPIPTETFTYKNLGLKDGDEFIDKTENKKYKYENANLVLISDLPAPSSSQQGSAGAEPNNPP